MKRLVGITFNTNNDTDNVGFMEYITGETGEVKYPIIRYKNSENIHRYYVLVENDEVKLSDYINEIDLKKVETCYQKKLRIEAIKFFFIELIGWQYVPQKSKV